MDKLQIFNNEQFGQVRMVEINNKVINDLREKIFQILRQEKISDIRKLIDNIAKNNKKR